MLLLTGLSAWWWRRRAA
ncbi:hypothetical protein P3T65_05940 [Pseudomonas nitroreducens]|nr:hypothetical protein [Pseudomonas nitroreducens]WEX00879.1 hypothetical protein P3T65_05940 [Pseudomonas nitroreducens]